LYLGVPCLPPSWGSLSASGGAHWAPQGSLSSHQAEIIRGREPIAHSGLPPRRVDEGGIMLNNLYPIPQREPLIWIIHTAKEKAPTPRLRQASPPEEPLPALNEARII